ncbi:TIGR03826 family flagellar region protein [Paenibacillus marinisediminis]
MELSNCYRCGRLFAKAFRDLCPHCLKDIEVEYNKCVDYLRTERKATMFELSEATGVSMSQITKFIREGRISIADAPNMFYDCETCGSPINVGNICEDCRRRLIGDLKRAQDHSEEDAARAARNASHQAATYRTSEKESNR